MDRRSGKSVVKSLSTFEVYLPLEGVIDLTEQVNRLKKELKKAEKEFEKYDKKMNNPKFLGSAPEHVQAEVKEKPPALAIQKVNSIKENIAQFEGQ